jgi:organic hydroperoxide reductase OsmC/OhrA
MSRLHSYYALTTWTGNSGSGTSDRHSYSRDHEISCPEKSVILGSSDPAFRGDLTRHNPEELLVASLSACHMLWYLSLCADAGIIVLAYADESVGYMTEDPNGSGCFQRVVLRPRITLAHGSSVEKAQDLHHKANSMCFIANSVNFPVEHEPSFLIDMLE